MIKLEKEVIKTGKFPDGTLLLKQKAPKQKEVTITWLFENNEEMVTLLFLVKHLRTQGMEKIHLKMPYIPNGRQDRVKTKEDVFTLKYFAEFINGLEFASVAVLDPHSYVSEALIDRIQTESPEKYVQKVVERLKGDTPLLMFYPDEGSMKRYSGMFAVPYAFGMKKRDWATGEIQGLEAAGEIQRISGSRVLIVDDICSRGGTFYYSAKKLKELGAKEVYLYVSHCENTILEGELLASGLVEKVFTTNSIFTEENERIEVFEYE